MKKVILFGTGRYGLEACEFFGVDNVLCFADNNKAIQGGNVNGIKVIDPNCIFEYLDRAIIVLAAREAVALQMKYQLLEQNIEQFIPYFLIRGIVSRNEIDIRNFLCECSTDAGIYKYMYECEVEQRLRFEERVEFFMRNTDIKSVKKAVGALRKLQLQYTDIAVELNKMVEESGGQLFLGCGTLIGAVRHQGFISWDDDMDFLMIREDYNKLIEYYSKKNMLYISDANPNNEAQIYDEMAVRMKSSPYDMELCFNGLFITAYKKIEGGNPVILDIFPLDYYREDTQYSQLVEYESLIEQNIKKISTVRGRFEYYAELQEENPFISKQPTSKIGYGTELVFDVKKGKDFYQSSDVYPLKKLKFEDYYFNAPFNSENFLYTEYGDIYTWPADAGENTHGREMRYISYRKNDKFVYIDSYDVVDKIIKSSSTDVIKNQVYIVRKYMITDICEYYKIVTKLDMENIKYYVYA